jgi:hypothetical protein
MHHLPLYRRHIGNGFGGNAGYFISSFCMDQHAFLPSVSAFLVNCRKFGVGFFYLWILFDFDIGVIKNSL